MDYYENTGDAVAKLKWTGPSFAGTNGVIIAKEWLYDGTGVTNRAAFAYPQSVTMLQNTNLAITLEGGGESRPYSIVTWPAHGSLTGTPPNVTYTPATNFTGLDSFTFVVNNGLSNSAPGHGVHRRLGRRAGRFHLEERRVQQLERRGQLDLRRAGRRRAAVLHS